MLRPYHAIWREHVGALPNPRCRLFLIDPSKDPLDVRRPRSDEYFIPKGEHFAPQSLTQAEAEQVIRGYLLFPVAVEPEEQQTSAKRKTEALSMTGDDLFPAEPTPESIAMRAEQLFDFLKVESGFMDGRTFQIPDNSPLLAMRLFKKLQAAGEECEPMHGRTKMGFLLPKRRIYIWCDIPA